MVSSAGSGPGRAANRPGVGVDVSLRAMAGASGGEVPPRRQKVPARRPASRRRPSMCSSGWSRRRTRATGADIWRRRTWASKSCGPVPARQGPPPTWTSAAMSTRRVLSMRPTDSSAAGGRRMRRRRTDGARQFNTVGRLMPSVAAMRLFVTPSPALSKALARVTTRYGADALYAPLVVSVSRSAVVSVSRSASLSSSSATGLFMPAGVLPAHQLSVRLFWEHTTSAAGQTTSPVPSTIPPFLH